MAIEALTSFISRYLLPRIIRLRLFALAVFKVVRTLPPAIYMTWIDAKAFEMQVDILNKYYRLEK